MAKQESGSQSKKVGNKAKARQITRNRSRGKYAVQRLRTERNRIKRQSRAWQRRKFKNRS